MTLRRLALWSPVLAALFVGSLFWAVGYRLDYWEVQPFILLLYGGMASVAAAHAATRLSRSRSELPLPAHVAELRGVMTLVVVVIALWVWCNPVMHPVVGWCVRQVSMWRFQ